MAYGRRFASLLPFPEWLDLVDEVHQVGEVGWRRLLLIKRTLLNLVKGLFDTFGIVAGYLHDSGNAGGQLFVG